MTLQFNLQGAERKTLVTAISQILETPAVYLKTPSYAYQVGEYHIDKNGTLTGPDNTDLQDLLHQNGFRADEKTYTCEELETEPTAEDSQAEDEAYEAALTEEQAIIDAQLADHENQLAAMAEMKALETETASIATEAEPNTLTIEMPLDGFTPEKLDILCRMVAAKETLLKTALGAEALPIQVCEDSIRFPWFQSENILTADEVEAYTTFISLLCTTAKEKKRVNGKEKQSDSSPKFLMRVFLLSLGGIGAEYKNMRKVLLSKLTGSSAWPKGAPTRLAIEGNETESETEVQNND